MEPLRLALLRLVIGDQAAEDLPMLAVDALVRGEDTEALRELAGTPRGEVRDARDLFLRAVSELGWSVPGGDAARRELARYWAAEMVAGRLAPYRASSLIWREAWNVLKDADLAVFAGLADQWEDASGTMEFIHQVRHDLEQRMIAEAKALLAVPS